MEFIDLKAQYAALKDGIDANIRSVVDSAQFIGGSFVEKLETQLAAFTGRKHCVTCANGTDALQLAYMALGVGRGDAVFCPDMTFISSTEPACMLGAVPVFCDIEPDTYCLSAASLERQVKAVLAEGRLTPKCVVAVDILGNLCDYDALGAICEKYGLSLIEDAAQSFGGSYHGKRAGAFGRVATTSFFPAKPLGCYGDGGAVFTNDEALADMMRSLCVHGKGPGGKYDNIRIGMNSRLDNLQAAVLLPKLKALGDYEMDARQTVAARYDAAFAGKFVTPFVAEGCVSAYAQYALLAKDTAQRDRIVAYLKEKNVPNMIYYPTPQHALPVFRDAPVYGETFQNSNDYCGRTFSLPMHPYQTEEDAQTVIDAVLEVAVMEGLTVGQLKTGDYAEQVNRILLENAEYFAKITNDRNPLHFDTEEARNSRFHRPIAHGMILAGYISGVIGSRLPGFGCLYETQEMAFVRPVYYGDTIRTRVTVETIDSARNRITLLTECWNQNGERVLTGRAVVLPRKPKPRG